MPGVGTGLFAVGLASQGGVGTRVGAAVVEIIADNTGVTSGFRQTEAQLRTFQGQMLAGSAIATRAGSSLTRNLTLPIVAIGGASVKMAADFETAFIRTNALAGVTRDRMGEFRAEIMRLSDETAQAPIDLANALYFVASAGLRDAQVIPVLRASAQAAATQITDAATAGHLLTGVLVAYGKEAPTAAQAMDVLTEAVRQGKAEPEELANNLGTVIPVAAEVGVGFDELAGAIAAATNVNVGAARAATGLRYMLIQMQNPTDAAKEAMEDFGLSARMVQRWVGEDLVTGLKRVADAFDLTTTKGREAFFTTIGGVRAGQIALALIGQSYDRTQGIMDATARAAGNMGDEFNTAYNKMRQTPGFELQRSWNRLKIAAIEVGQVLLPVATEFIGAVGEMAEAFSNLPEPVQETIVRTAAYLALLGPGLLLLGKFGAGLAFIARTFGGVALAATTAAATAGPAVQKVAGLMLPVQGPASSIGAGAAAGAQLRRIGLMAAGFAKLSILAGEVGVAFGIGSRVLDDFTTSEGDLSEATGLTAEQVGNLADQFASGAAGLNLFRSRADLTRETAERMAAVVQQLVQRGYSLSQAQILVNQAFEGSIEVIGGFSGSMDRFSRSLEARTGVLSMADAQTLLNERLSAFEDVSRETAAGVVYDQDAMNDAMKNLVASIISVRRSGLDLAEVMGPQLREAVNRGLITWEQLGSAFERAGAKMPFREAGQFQKALFMTADASIDARRDFARLLGELDRAGIVIPKAARETALYQVWHSRLAEATRTVTRAVQREANAMVTELVPSMNRGKQAAVAAALAHGDLARVLEILRRRRQRLQEQAADDDRADVWGAKGASAAARQYQQMAQSLLQGRRRVAQFGDSFAEFASKVKDPSLTQSVGTFLNQLDKVPRRITSRINVALQEGNVRGVFREIMNAIQWINDHPAAARTSAPGANEAAGDLRGVADAVNSIDRFVSVSVGVNVSGLEAATASIWAVKNLAGSVRAGGGQTGGWVPGRGRGDRIPMLLEPGEFIVRREVAQRNRPFLQEFNRHGADRVARPRSDSGRIRGEAGGRTTIVNVRGKVERPEDIAFNLDWWERARGW